MNCLLGIENNTWKTLSSLDDDEKGATNSSTPGGEQRVSIINEAGLYSLILRSRKPEAKTFCTFVTVQVRPTPFAEDVKAFFAFLLTEDMKHHYTLFC